MVLGMPAAFEKDQPVLPTRPSLFGKATRRADKPTAEGRHQAGHPGRSYRPIIENLTTDPMSSSPAAVVSDLELAIQLRPTLPETVAMTAEINKGMIPDLYTSKGKVH